MTLNFVYGVVKPTWEILEQLKTLFYFFQKKVQRTKIVLVCNKEITQENILFK